MTSFLGRGHWIKEGRGHGGGRGQKIGENWWRPLWTAPYLIFWFHHLFFGVWGESKISYWDLLTFRTQITFLLQFHKTSFGLSPKFYGSQRDFCPTVSIQSRWPWHLFRLVFQKNCVSKKCASSAKWDKDIYQRALFFSFSLTEYENISWKFMSKTFWSGPNNLERTKNWPISKKFWSIPKHLYYHKTQLYL